MTKQSGLGDQLFIDGHDIGADINQISSLSSPRATLPATAITQSAEARMFGTRDATAEFTSFFDPATGAAHDVLSALPTGDVQVMYLRGQGQGSKAYCINGKQIDYAPSRGDDGALTIGTSVSSNSYGADWCVQLTSGIQTDAEATDSDGVDLGGGGSLAYGFQAYLQVFSLGSGSADIKLQTSSDDGDADTYADLTDGAFTTVTDRTAERIQSSSATATVEQYVRVVTEGTFTDLVFVVVINRNRGVRAL